MKVGYVRVSTKDQNTIRQEISMKELGVEKIFIEKVSGKDIGGRKALQDMMAFVREGDIVIVHEISRFARNTRDLLNLVDELTNKGVQFVSKKENIDTSTGEGKFMLTIFGAISQLERDYILSRQKEGIDAAVADGRYGHKPRIPIDMSEFEKEYNLWKEDKITAVAMMKHLDLKPNTFYRRVKEYEIEKGIRKKEL